MPVRTNGGVFCDQVLTGSLQHFRIVGADFTGAVDSNNMPVHGSAAEIIYNEISRRATISIMNPITNPLGMSFALETGRAGWTAAEIEVFVRSLGVVGVDNVDVSNVTVEQVYYNLIPTGSGAATFLDLTDTPASYTGEGGKVLAVKTTEDGVEFITVSGGGLVDSVFGRIGDVIAQPGDYDADQIDYDNTTSGLSATEVQSAIDEVNANVINLSNQLSNLVLNDLSDVDVTGVTDGQGILWDSATGNWLASNITTTTPDKVLFHHNGVISQVLSTSFSVILFNFSTSSTSAITYNNATGEFTINEDGQYGIECDMSFTTTTAARKNAQVKLQLDGVDVPGSFAYTYNRNTVNGESTGSLTMELDMTGGQIIRILARGTTGTVKTIPSACRIRIIKRK